MAPKYTSPTSKEDKSTAKDGNSTGKEEIFTTKPANDYKATLQDVVELFQQFEMVTIDYPLHEANYHFPTEAGGLPFAISNIRAVADECRRRYQRDRTALIKAFKHLLEAENLIRQPLGKRTWEDLDITNTALTDEWKRKCVGHIDETMGVLEAVEKEAHGCLYEGNWEQGWTYEGCFPRGKNRREIGRRKRYSNDTSDEDIQQSPRSGKKRKLGPGKTSGRTTDDGCEDRTK